MVATLEHRTSTQVSPVRPSQSRPGVRRTVARRPRSVTVAGSCSTSTMTPHGPVRSSAPVRSARPTTPAPTLRRRRHRPSAAVYRRRRVVAAGVVLVLLGVARQAGAALGGTSLATPERHPRVITYVVQPGDTLWAIAGRVAPGEDPRGVVDALRDARDSDVLFPGETITWVAD